MTYNSKRTLTSMAAGLIIMIAYIIYAMGEYAPDPDNLKSWAIAMLAFVGIGVIGLIIIQILFHILYAIGVAIKEQKQSEKDIERIIQSAMVEDERNKMIDLKATHIGYIFIGIGFIATLVAFALGVSIVPGLHIILAAFSIGSLIEGAMSIYLFERGVHNG